MDKLEAVVKVVGSLKALTDDLAALAVVLASTDRPDSGVAEEPDQLSRGKPTVSLVEVRTRLGELSRAGYTAQVRTILERHGANRLSEIDPGEYAAILVEAEELSNAPV